MVNLMDQSGEILFMLLRAALGKGAVESLPSDIDWPSVIDLSFSQGVSALVVDGLHRVCEAYPDMELLLDSEEMEDAKYEWYGAVFSCEYDYSRYLAKLQRLIKFYRSEGIRTMVLKGYGLGLNYPIPSHRPTGDVDIYQFGRWEEADALSAAKLGVTMDNSHHHHSVFNWKGLTVENHYDFVNVHSHWSSADVERKLKSLASVGRTVDGIDLPSADFNALFVIRHIAAHFAAEGMNLRQLLDWALFVRSASAEVDWKAAWECYCRWNMHRFVLCIDEIAVRWLGFERGIFGIPEEFADFGVTEAALVDRVLEEILHLTKVEGGYGCLLVYVWRRLRQWWQSRWKHRIVYSDSLVSTFLWQVRSHLMKPATLIGK